MWFGGRNIMVRVRVGKKRVIIGLTIVIAITIIATLGIGGIKVVNAKTISSSLELGIKYLTEGKYDKEKEENDYLIGKETLQNQIKELEEELKDVKYIDITEMEKDSNCLKEQLNNLQIDLNKQKAKLITIRNTIENIINIAAVLPTAFETVFSSFAPATLPIITVEPIERPTITTVSMCIIWLPMETADIISAPLNLPDIKRSARPYNVCKK